MIKKNNISDCGNCYREDELIKFVNNELNDAESAAIESHLTCCEMCSDVVDSLFMMDSPKQLNAEKNILNKAVAKLIAGDRKRKTLNSATIRSIAAVALLLIISGTYFIADYLVSKKEITEIRTADNENSEKTNIDKPDQTMETELADRKTVTRKPDKETNNNLLFSSPLHEFDSDYKVTNEEMSSEALDFEANELTINDVTTTTISRTVTTGDNRNPTKIKTKSEDKRGNTVSSFEEPIGSSTNQSNSRDFQRASGESSEILILSERKTEENTVKKTEDKKETDSKRNQVSQDIPATSNNTIVESIVLEQNNVSVIMKDEISEETPGCIAFTSVEERPVYPGGDVALLKFIRENTNYPEIAKENSIQGKVFVQFIIDKAGNVTDAKVVKGVDPTLNEEALRVINMLPKWSPGKQRGKLVNVSYIIPINFYLY